MGSFALCAGLSSRTITRPQIALPSGFLLLGALAFSMLRWQRTFSHAGAVIICFFAYAYIESVRNKFAMAVQQLRNKRELRELAEQDPLTGLPNRRHFNRKLEALCLESMPFSVLYIDLDGFKQVNDRHGHTMGDLLLQDVADRLRSSIRSADLLARLGGDEFAILQTPQCLPDPPQALAVRINCAMARPFVLDGKEICISASVGIQSAASTEAHAPRNSAFLLSNADAALYRVKQAGGGGYAMSEDHVAVNR
jgi:diguanylate cyclase (GGDEF)-like protein